MPSGGFDTLLSHPGEGYFESSGSALVAAAWFKGMRLGYLDPHKFQAPAWRAFERVQGVVDHDKKGRVRLSEVSGPTIPTPSFVYKLMPRGEKYPWGPGAFLLMSTEALRYHQL